MRKHLWVLFKLKTTSVLRRFLLLLINVQHDRAQNKNIGHAMFPYPYNSSHCLHRPFLLHRGGVLTYYGMLHERNVTISKLAKAIIKNVEVQPHTWSQPDTVVLKMKCSLSVVKSKKTPSRTQRMQVQTKCLLHTLPDAPFLAGYWGDWSKGRSYMD